MCQNSASKLCAMRLHHSPTVLNSRGTGCSLRGRGFKNWASLAVSALSMPAGAPVVCGGANLPPSSPPRLFLLVLVRCWPCCRLPSLAVLPRRPAPARQDPLRFLPPRFLRPPRELPPLMTMSDGPRSQALFGGIDHSRRRASSFTIRAMPRAAAGTAAAAGALA